MGDESYTYAYLRKAITRYLNKLKEEANRKQICQALANAGKGPAAAAHPKGPKNKGETQVAAPGKGDPKGKSKGNGDLHIQPCYRERDNGVGKCDRANCPYKHAAPALASPPARSKAKPKYRSPSPKPAGAKPICHFFKKGQCKYG